MNKSKKNTATTIIAMIIIAGIIVVGYFLITNRSQKVSSDTNEEKTTEIQKLLSRDLKEQYPFSPREVLKFYSRIIKCYYNDNLSDEQLDRLSDQMLLLFDDELLLENPKEAYLADLKTEIKSYHEAEKKLVTYVIQKNSFIEYQTMNSDEYATILASYSLKQKKPKVEIIKIYERFLLRKNEAGEWKIVGWQDTEPVDFEGE